MSIIYHKYLYSSDAFGAEWNLNDHFITRLLLFVAVKEF